MKDQRRVFYTIFNSIFLLKNDQISLEKIEITRLHKKKCENVRRSGNV
jgi:hypothetical protein